MEDVIGELGGERHGPGKTIRFEGADPGLCVRGDQARLRQVLTNILSNALKFTGEHGVVDVRIERVEDGVDVIVADDGIGIPEDKLAVVLQPFSHCVQMVSVASGLSHGRDLKR